MGSGVGEDGNGECGRRGKYGNFFCVEIIEELVEFVNGVGGDGCCIHNRSFFTLRIQYSHITRKI